ncbi:MAG: thioredoxin-disulfide reductase [Coriobacteriia bacterium]|nr:thioredoxin-disulfide reductase [Coriobacteriia bacterium]
MNEVIDIAIVGGGPAGLTAALYGARARANTVVFESQLPGGAIITTDWIENYPGMPEGLNGSRIGELMHAHAEKFGARFHTFVRVERIREESGGFILSCDDGEEYPARTVILSTGSIPRKLGVPGEAEFTGRGVSWCATCDGALFRGKTVAVIGGGDAAVEEALFLTKFAEKVYLIHRRDELRATKCIQERAIANEKIELVLSRIPIEITGHEGRVSGVRLQSTAGEADQLLPLDGVFEFIGVHPNSELVSGLVDLSGAGWVKIDSSCMTSVPGLFAAGDVTDTPLKQVVTAAGQGATAAFEALRHVDSGVCTL